jgi:hypothetical protein
MQPAWASPYTRMSYTGASRPWSSACQTRSRSSNACELEDSA